MMHLGFFICFIWFCRNKRNRISREKFGQKSSNIGKSSLRGTGQTSASQPSKVRAMLLQLPSRTFIMIHLQCPHGLVASVSERSCQVVFCGPEVHLVANPCMFAHAAEHLELFAPLRSSKLIVWCCPQSMTQATHVKRHCRVLWDDEVVSIVKGAPHFLLLCAFAVVLVDLEGVDTGFLCHMIQKCALWKTALNARNSCL